MICARGRSYARSVAERNVTRGKGRESGRVRSAQIERQGKAHISNLQGKIDASSSQGVPLSECAGGRCGGIEADWQARYGQQQNHARGHAVWCNI